MKGRYYEMSVLKILLLLSIIIIFWNTGHSSEKDIFKNCFIVQALPIDFLRTHDMTFCSFTSNLLPHMT